MLQYESLSNRLVPALFLVHKSLGPGLLESVYEQAMAVELSHLGIPFIRQQAHQGIGKIPDEKPPHGEGMIKKQSVLFGLHHHYYRSAA